MSGTILAPKEYRREMERLKTAPQYQELFARNAGHEDRVARNIMTANKIWERADYGRFADVRELIALRLAPWLRPQRPR